MDKFENIDKLGKGSFGKVRLVERKEDKQLFALKTIELTEDKPAKNTANDTLLQSLEHPNIIKCYDTFIENNKLCILMEYAENGDLHKRVKEAKNKGIYLPEDIIWNWFAQLCLAVNYLSDNKILHRDIKLQNTFLMKDGLIKLGDFGTSKQLENTDEFAKTSLGTPYYLSPEMCSSATYNHKSDIWMLGCLLHELCSLEKPFSGNALEVVIKNIVHESYSEVPEHYSQAIHQLIRTLLEKDPVKRPNISNILQTPETRSLKTIFPTKYENCLSLLEANNEIKLIQAKEDGKNPTINTFEKYREFMDEKPESTEIVETQSDLRTRTTEIEKVTKGNSQTPSSVDNTKPPLPESNSVKKGKYHQNSLQYILQQKAKQNFSPSNADRGTNATSSSTNSTQSKEISLVKIESLPENTPGSKGKEGVSRKKISSLTDLAQEQNAEELKTKAQTTKRSSNNIDADSFESRTLRHVTEYKKPSYQRDISINTALEPMYGSSKLRSTKKDSSTNYKSPNNEGSEKSPNSIPTSKVTQKNFSFSDHIFDPKSPVSPHRSLMFGHFIKDRIGEQKFEKLKQLFANSDDPVKFLESQKKTVIEIIGEQHKDCIVFLKYMFSSSLTPKTTDNKFSVFDQVKSPSSIKNSTPSNRNSESSNSVKDQATFSDLKPEVAVGEGTVIEEKGEEELISKTKLSSV